MGAFTSPLFSLSPFVLLCTAGEDREVVFCELGDKFENTTETPVIPYARN
jgi:hypothetical protein